MTIVTEQSLRLDWECNWKHLVSYEDFLLIQAQRSVFLSNEKGYQVNSVR
jgi:hypothetical protein